MPNIIDEKRRSIVIEGETLLTSVLEGDLDLTSTIDGEAGVVIAGTGTSYPVYTGPYTVTPLAYNAQTLNTANKITTADVTVLKVPYYETSNLSGGYTAYIAEE